MGIRDELQTDVAAAFDTDLQDAVKDFTGSYTVRGAWDPVTETLVFPLQKASGK
ncbi:Uncharacterised protein [Klebsiella variicola]|nr:Uncharacterised protein [Klebsiella variicola]